MIVPICTKTFAIIAHKTKLTLMLIEYAPSYQPKRRLEQRISIESSLVKGQIKSEWIWKSSNFQISNLKIWRISALKVYLKLKQKVVKIILSIYDKPSLNMQKKLDQIVLSNI